MEGIEEDDGTLEWAQRFLAHRHKKTRTAMELLKTSTDRPCKTCRYAGWSLFLPSGLKACNRPNRPMDLVTGQPVRLYMSVQREFDSGCGREGRYHSDIFPAK